MIRRIVDLTQTMKPMNDYQRDYPPPWPDFEATGPERMRIEMQRMVAAEPFHLDGNPDELLMNIFIGHSTGHTHVDCFLHDWNTMNTDLPRSQKWTQRDISQVPSHELLGPAAVVDVSDIAPFGIITLDYFKEKAKHVIPGDIVFIKSGHPAIVKSHAHKTGDFTVVPPEAAYWLAQEKQVRVCGFDHKINGNFVTWSKTEAAFYRSGILMIDRMANLDALESGARYFANIGVSMKLAGSDDSPARVFVIDKLNDITNGSSATDLFFPVVCDKPEGTYPYQRSEPYALRHAIMNRCRLENIHITQTEYSDSFGGLGFMAFKSFCNHLGTHIQVPNYPMTGLQANEDFDLGAIATDKLWGKCAMINAWSAGPGQNVTVAMLEKHAATISEGTIVIIRTAYSDYYFGSPDYLRNSPGLSDDAVRWLVDRKVKMIVTDFASVESAKVQNQIGEHDHLKELFRHGIPVVNNAYSLWRMRKSEAVAFISPMAFPGINASPCRVMVYEEYK